MYKNYYQQGGQADQMQQMMTQIMQAFQQLPHEAQMQLLEAMNQQMQGQMQEQPMEGEQGMPQEASPEQVQEIARMGGMRPKKSGYSQMYR